MEALGAIGVPSQDTLYTAFFKSYVGLEKPAGTVLFCTEGTLTAQARNQMFQQVLEAKSIKWVFFMDSDMLFPSIALTHLLSTDKDIVGGVYFQRFHPHDIIAYEYKGIEGGTHQYRSINPEWQEYARRRQSFIPIASRFTGALIGRDIRECDAIGTGCLLVRRKVIEAIPSPWFSYAEEGSEDLYFCRKAKSAGFKIHLSMGLLCGHVSRTVVGPLHHLSSAGELQEVPNGRK